MLSCYSMPTNNNNNNSDRYKRIATLLLDAISFGKCCHSFLLYGQLLVAHLLAVLLLCVVPFAFKTIFFVC